MAWQGVNRFKNEEEYRQALIAHCQETFKAEFGIPFEQSPWPSGNLWEDELLPQPVRDKRAEAQQKEWHAEQQVARELLRVIGKIEALHQPRLERLIREADEDIELIKSGKFKPFLGTKPEPFERPDNDYHYLFGDEYTGEIYHPLDDVNWAQPLTQEFLGQTLSAIREIMRKHFSGTNEKRLRDAVKPGAARRYPSKRMPHVFHAYVIHRNAGCTTNFCGVYKRQFDPPCFTDRELTLAFVLDGPIKSGDLRQLFGDDEDMLSARHEDIIEKLRQRFKETRKSFEKSMK
jgi:hypothetical protein